MAKAKAAAETQPTPESKNQFPKQSAKKAGARVALLDAAQKSFTQKGYAAVSTRELADEAGVNLGAIQYHFGSKAQLFVETVRLLMRQKHEGNVLLEEVECRSAEEAAVQICLFIRRFLSDVCHPTGPDACRLMYREILGATDEEPELHEALVSSVVTEFIAPLDARLKQLVAIIRPNGTERERSMVVQSIIGQCSFYFTHRPFVERLRGVDFTKEPIFTEVTSHVASFTLRGIGLNETEIASAVSAAMAQ